VRLPREPLYATTKRTLLRIAAIQSLVLGFDPGGRGAPDYFQDEQVHPGVVSLRMIGVRLDMAVQDILPWKQ
jgi:hypothetical protein